MISTFKQQNKILSYSLYISFLIRNSYYCSFLNLWTIIIYLNFVNVLIKPLGLIFKFYKLIWLKIIFFKSPNRLIKNNQKISSSLMFFKNTYSASFLLFKNLRFNKNNRLAITQKLFIFKINNSFCLNLFYFFSYFLFKYYYILNFFLCNLTNFAYENSVLSKVLFRLLKPNSPSLRLNFRNNLLSFNNYLI